MYKSLQAGFTLVELLVVVAIIGVLSGLVTVNVLAVKSRSRDNQRQADLSTLAVGLENYRADQKSYPPATTSGGPTSALSSYLVPAYIQTLPKDPTPTQTYQYYTNATQSLFAIDATMENTAPASSLISGNGFSATDATQTGFYQTGFYKDGAGKTHYRLATQ